MKTSQIKQNTLTLIRLHGLKVALIFSLLFGFIDSWSQQKKYNVIFINMDDMSIAFQTYGNPYAPTPNINRLAQHGVLFKNVYTQYTLCSPSRTSAFSGTRTRTTQITNNQDSIRKGLGAGFRFLPEYFHDYGYRTESYGKFMCNHDDEVSWDYYINETHGGDNFTHDDEGSEGLTGKPAFTNPGRQEPIWFIDTLHKKIDGTDDGKETNEFIHALKNPVSTPFFYNLGLQTHNTFTPLLEYWNMTGDSSVSELLPVDSGAVYTNVYGNGSANIPLPVSPPDDTADVPHIALKYLYHYTPDDVQRLRHAYYSEMIQADANLGKVIDQLDSLDLWKNSVVVFWSDHGLSMGEHDGMWLKLDMFEECLRIPMIICVPGIKPAVCDKLVESVDLFQTLTELCNIPVPSDREGSTLVPLLEKTNIKWKKAIYSNLMQNNGDTLLATAVRTGNWHYNNWQEEGEELYDMVNDPYEITNLALNPAYTDTLNKMRKLLNDGWQSALPPAYRKRTFYRDNDGDGFGNKADTVSSYFGREGYVSEPGDCNDNNKNINPASSEQPCNGIDDNCDNNIDDNNPVPEIEAGGSLDICLTGKVTLNANAGNNIKYQWTFNNINIPGANQKSYVARVVGTYAVREIKNECDNISPGMNVYSSCSAANENEQSEVKGNSPVSLSAAPNPSSGLFMLNFTCLKDGNIVLLVCNAAGQNLLTRTIKAAAGNNNYQLDLSNLKPGVYQLVLGNNQRIKLIKN